MSEPNATSNGPIKVWHSGLLPVAQYFEVQRTPSVFKIVNTGNTAGDVTLWTPAVGAKFRLMGFSISWGDMYYTPGTLFEQITIRDATDNIEIFRCGAIIGNAYPQIPIVINYPANGYLSSQVNSSLVLNKSATMTGGSANISLYGCEE